MCTIASIANTECPNPPGVIRNIYIVPVTLIDDFPTIDLVEGDTTGDLTMTSGTALVWQSVEEDTRFGFESVGEIDSKSVKQTASIRIKGYDAKSIATLTQATSVPVVMFVTDNGSGEVKMYGTKDHPLKSTTLTGSTGATGSTDRAGSVIALEANGLQHGPVKYNGTLP